MKEIIGNILKIIASWFSIKQQKTEHDNKVEDARVEAAVSTVQAEQAVSVIAVNEHINEKLNELEEKHKQEDNDDKKKPIDEVIDDQFSSDW